MKNCDYYHEERYSENGSSEYSIGFCSGTREREKCSCKGNRSKCNFYPEVRKDALKEAACQFGKWIDIKDALPETHQVIIVYDDYYNVVSSSYLTESGDWYEMPKDSHITHWMNLPKPPCK